MQHFDEILPGRIHRVHYEQLVKEPEGELRKLLGYCGLPFEEQCLRFHENRRAVSTLSSEQVRQPLYTESVDHWRNYDEWLGPLKSALGELVAQYPVRDEPRMTDIHATLESARALHRQGRLAEAMPLYREVLTLEPRNVEALQLLGVALASMGDFERATVLLSAAAQLAPHSAAIQANLAGALSGSGRWQEALSCLRACAAQRAAAAGGAARTGRRADAARAPRGGHVGLPQGGTADAGG